jgi:hypothetical protein
VIAAVAAGMAVLASAGCVAGRPAAPAAPAPAAAPAVPPLPIQEYMFDLAGVHRANQARYVLTGKCMAALGQPFTAPPVREVTAQWEAQLRSRRYGVSDPGTVATLGYHPPTGGVDDSPPVLASMTEEQRTAFQGPPATAGGEPPAARIHGRPVPVGGCLGEATRAIAPAGGYARSALATSIDFDSFRRSRADRRVVDAIAAWSACMARSGHRYADPLAATADPRWRAGPTPAPAELDTARDDLACKDRTGLVRTWTAVEAEHQRQQIGAHRADLDALRADRDAQLARVAEILRAA